MFQLFYFYMQLNSFGFSVVEHIWFNALFTFICVVRTRTSFDLVPQMYNSKLFAEILVLTIITKMFQRMKKQLEGEYEKVRQKTKIWYKI